MIILGIDPGLARTGYGIIKEKKGLQCLTYGLIETQPSLPKEKRLQSLDNQLMRIMRDCPPDFLAIENIYFFKNQKTAIPVAQAKGVILLRAAKKKIPVYEFTPLEIKMAITGYGRADKKQMQRMIKEWLGLEELPKDDAADALGAAVCCVRTIEYKEHITNPGFVMSEPLDNRAQKNIISG